MIKSIKHKGLKAYWTKGQVQGIKADFRPRVFLIMDLLDRATLPEQMDIPGYGFHSLKGDRKGDYAVKVNKNFRITFAWDLDCATNVDLEDYH